MLDIKNLPASAKGRIIKTVPKTDPEASGTLIWEVDIVFDVQSLGDARVLEKIVPGASSVYESGQLGSKGEVKDRSQYDITRCYFWDESNKTRIASCHSYINQAIVRANGPSSVFILKLKLHGLITEQAIKIVNLLDNEVVISLDSVKNEAIKSFSKIKTKDTTGYIVVLDDGVDLDSPREDIGVVAYTKPGIVAIYTNDQEILEVDRKYIKHFIKTPFGKDYKEYIDLFFNRCGTNNYNKDIVYILEAISHAFGANDMSMGNKNASYSIIERAVLLSKGGE